MYIDQKKIAYFHLSFHHDLYKIGATSVIYKVCKQLAYIDQKKVVVSHFNFRHDL